jgi:hypothetical protein
VPSELELEPVPDGLPGVPGVVPEPGVVPGGLPGGLPGAAGCPLASPDVLSAVEPVACVEAAPGDVSANTAGERLLTIKMSARVSAMILFRESLLKYLETLLIRLAYLHISSSPTEQ